MNRKILAGTAALCCGAMQAIACTGISLTAKDGSYVQARTIEAAAGALKSEYVVIPRGQTITSFTPSGINGLEFTARYGVVGMSVVMKEFICEGINEAGLSAGLFFFPHYGQYEPYDASLNNVSLGDLQVPTWILSQFATIDEVKEGIKNVRIVGLDAASVVHYRIGEPSGRQVVLEIVNGVPNFYENSVGVLTNSPGFQWHLTNLNNYVNQLPIAKWVTLRCRLLVEIRDSWDYRVTQLLHLDLCALHFIGPLLLNSPKRYQRFYNASIY